MFGMEQSRAAIRTLFVDLQVHGVIEESSSCWAWNPSPWEALLPTGRSHGIEGTPIPGDKGFFWLKLQLEEIILGWFPKLPWLCGLLECFHLPSLSPSSLQARLALCLRTLPAFSCSLPIFLPGISLINSCMVNLAVASGSLITRDSDKIMHLWWELHSIRLRATLASPGSKHARTLTFQMWQEKEGRLRLNNIVASQDGYIPGANMDLFLAEFSTLRRSQMRPSNVGSISSR